MKCPIRYNVWVDKENKPILLDQECLKEECEWWSNSSQLCVLPRLAGELYSLVEVMEEIRDKLDTWLKTQGVRG